MTYNEIKNAIYSILEDKGYLNFVEKEKRFTAKFSEDYGLDSIDFVEFIMELESRFKIVISDEKADDLKSVSDVLIYVYDKVNPKQKSIKDIGCNGCSRCCTTPSNPDRTPFFDIDSTEKYVVPKYEMKEEDKCFHCVYLKNGLCSVYEKRPTICRTWPAFLVKIDGINKLGIATYNCGLGNSIIDELYAGNPKIQDELRDIKSKLEATLSEEEILQQTSEIVHKYKVMTFLNL